MPFMLAPRDPRRFLGLSCPSAWAFAVGAMILVPACRTSDGFPEAGATRPKGALYPTLPSLEDRYQAMWSAACVLRGRLFTGLQVADGAFDDPRDWDAVLALYCAESHLSASRQPHDDLNRQLDALCTHLSGIGSDSEHELRSESIVRGVCRGRQPRTLDKERYGGYAVPDHGGDGIGTSVGAETVEPDGWDALAWATLLGVCRGETPVSRNAKVASLSRALDVSVEVRPSSFLAAVAVVQAFSYTQLELSENQVAFLQQFIDSGLRAGCMETAVMASLLSNGQRGVSAWVGAHAYALLRHELGSEAPDPSVLSACLIALPGGIRVPPLYKLESEHLFPAAFR